MSTVVAVSPRARQTLLLLLPDLNRMRVQVSNDNDDDNASAVDSEYDATTSLSIRGPPRSSASRLSSALSTREAQYAYNNTLRISGVVMEQARDRLPATSLARRAAQDLWRRATENPAAQRLVVAARAVIYEPFDPTRRPGSDRDPYTAAINSLPSLDSTLSVFGPVASHSQPLLLFAAHKVCDSIHALVASFAPESAYQSAIDTLVADLFSLPEYTGLATAREVSTSPDLLNALGLSALIAVRPDLVVGLNRDRILVRQNRTSPPGDSRQTLIASFPHDETDALPDSLLLDQYVQSRLGRNGLSIYVANHAQLSFKPWFEFIFFELKALGGSVSKGRLQSATAMRISLDVISHLAQSAYAADPDHFMPPDKDMACVWSVRSCGADIEVWTMTYDAGLYTTTRVCRLSLDDASDLCTLLSLINAIAVGAERRHELVGNWLWCLRSSVKPFEAPRRPKRQKTSRVGSQTSRREAPSAPPRETGSTARSGEQGGVEPSEAGAGAVLQAVGLGPEGEANAPSSLITGTINGTCIRTPSLTMVHPSQASKSAVRALEKHYNDGDVYRRVRHWRTAIKCDDDERDHALWWGAHHHTRSAPLSVVDHGRF